jgi:hypothetical protein
MRQSIQEAIPLLRDVVTGVQTNPNDGTIKLRGDLGSVSTKPQLTHGLVALQVVDVTGLGLLLPSEMVQSALDAFTTRLTENYPPSIHADSVQITMTVRQHIIRPETCRSRRATKAAKGSRTTRTPASQTYRPGEHGAGGRPPLPR